MGDVGVTDARSPGGTGAPTGGQRGSPAGRSDLTASPPDGGPNGLAGGTL